MSPWSHSKKQVRDALDEAHEGSFAPCATPAGHRWGYITCPTCGQWYSIYSTPKNADNHAKQIRHFLKRHQHDDEGVEQ